MRLYAGKEKNSHAREIPVDEKNSHAREIPVDEKNSHAREIPVDGYEPKSNTIFQYHGANGTDAHVKREKKEIHLKTREAQIKDTPKQ